MDAVQRNSTRGDKVTKERAEGKGIKREHVVCEGKRKQIIGT